MIDKDSGNRIHLHSAVWTVFSVILALMLTGCYGLVNQYYLRGSPGYEANLRELKARAEGGEYLSKNPAPRVITVASNGSIYVYPEDGHRYREFTARGSSFGGSVYNRGVPDIVYQGWKEHDRLKKIDNSAKEQKRLQEVKNAIKHPRKITMEEFLGIKPNENMKSRLNNKIPSLFGDTESYRFNTHEGMSQEQLANLYMAMSNSGYYPPSESVQGVNIVHGFEFYYVDLKHTTGEFYSYCLKNRSLPVGEKYDAALSAVLDDIRAFMHTDANPDFSESETTGHEIMRTWIWKSFETLDHNFFDITLSAHPYGKSWMLLLTVRKAMDPAEIAQKNKECSDFWSMSMNDVMNQIQTEKEESKHLEGPIRDLYNRVKRYLVVVKSDKGIGSGFLAKDQGGVYFYTNEHVVRGSNKPKVLGIDGEEISLGDFELAKGMDLVRFVVKDRVDALEVNHQGTDLNMPVTVFGNSDGVGVVTAQSGKILGIGPSMIEVSAEFVQGNSGSPVLTMDGQVVGIATFAIDATEKENWVKKDTRFNGVRRFALRIDNVNWKKMDWELYSTIINR